MTVDCQSWRLEYVRGEELADERGCEFQIVESIGMPIPVFTIVSLRFMASGFFDRIRDCFRVEKKRQTQSVSESRIRLVNLRGAEKAQKA